MNIGQAIGLIFRLMFLTQPEWEVKGARIFWGKRFENIL